MEALKQMGGLVGTQISRIVDAIAEGMMHESMREKLTDLEDRKKELKKALQKMGKDEPLRLHPGLADIYRRKVEHLATALNHPESRTHAAEILRGLISEIRLTPSDDGHDIELVGELAAIMALDGAKNKKAQPKAGQVSETMALCNLSFVIL